MSSEQDPSTLAKIPLFHGLTAEQLSSLGTLLYCRTFPAGTALIKAEEPGEAAYIVLSGSVRIYTEQANGKNVILSILGTGDVVGEMSLVDSLSRSANAVTQEESTLLWMDRLAFQKNLREMPVMAYNLTNILSRRLRLANTHAKSLATLDIPGRIAAQLLALAQEYGETTLNGDVTLPFRLTQSDLADMVGASRVRVNQALSFYKRHNYLSVDRNHRITIHDTAILAKRCR